MSTSTPSIAHTPSASAQPAQASAAAGTVPASDGEQITQTAQLGASSGDAEQQLPALPSSADANLKSEEAPAPPGQVFSDIEELKQHLQDWAGEHGFAISCTSSRGGDYYTMRCKRARGGGGGCPWTMVVRRFFFAVDKNPDGRLAWTTTNFTHNHPPLPRGTFAVHRRPTPEVRDYIERAGERGEKPRVILNAVRRMEGCAEFDIDTVYYIIAQRRRKSRAERAVSLTGSAAGGGSTGVGEAGPSRENGNANAGAQIHGSERNGDDHLSGEARAHGEIGTIEVHPVWPEKPDGDETLVHGEMGEAEPGPATPDVGPAPSASDTPARIDARGRAKPWCPSCNSYIRHHGSCPRDQRKRKAAGDDSSYVDAGVQTEPLDIFKDPMYARQIAAILLSASENIKERAGL
ncbi:hypothetical protein CC85DRAFT_287728 [Cutaneotrichosporon oleaginosum]|uniref:Uncharacterized protein n=1 Tax=Cutaneotrichosporon oleaginosum TaxID=879819 RepID=A0A0J0XGQ2_9TREE|nr:uncharacterized protein CC85DRAFT_287728 [Cutaneotrichosporon oleaginosum]KLT40207.1 hypothetical protein CC85DRAFT_287728 [Cutaneotrichosporon oleaginosum]TXT10503.1 hypothetical protein COLE_04437 [Cutaneotrichosporon oleaginosum]